MCDPNPFNSNHNAMMSKEGRPMGKSGPHRAVDSEVSFRSNRTYTNYNLSDFLPPSRTGYSQVTPSQQPRHHLSVTPKLAT